MAVVQQAFYIPADIMTKLLTGEYRRYGGVIRYAVGSNKGNIVKHLDPIDLKVAEQAKGVVAQIMKGAKKNKKYILIGVAVASVATAGGIIYHKVKNREPKAVTKFRAALRIYIEEIRNGNPELKTIESLMSVLDKLKSHKDYEKYKIELSTDDIDALVGRIYDYTIHFAENNQIELTEQEKYRTDNPILNLQNYLKIQKSIFERAA